MKKDTIIKAKLSELVEDFGLYPRNQVDSAHVGDLLRAQQSGAEFPPIIVDASSKRIIDGFHRVRMYRKALGDEAVIDVVSRVYPDDAAMFLDAVRLNAAHGRKLDRHDHVRIVLRLQELGIDQSTIALTLHVPEPQVQRLAVRVVYDQQGGAVPLKRGTESLRGETLTAEQLAVMGSVRSAEVGRLALELTRLLNAGLVDWANQKVVTRLTELHSALDVALAAHRKVA